jgi:hypothetical protein
MLINDLVALLSQTPPVLAAQWGVWFAVGLGLSIWGRRERARLVIHDSGPRPKSGVRPPARQVRSVARSSGDAFGELEALLDNHDHQTQGGSHRTPGEPSSPSNNEPLRSAPVLAAPQSLP